MKSTSSSVTVPAIDCKAGRIRMVVLLSLSFLLIAADSPGDASNKVNEGLQLFRNNQFSEAETAFAEAGEISPENSIILFDEACAALAGNDAEQARGLFRKASLTKDSALAVKAHYNLGCLEADQARSKLGDDPAAAEGETREQSINMLLTSIRSYRDVLRLEPAHQDARHNIELIRLYIKHLQSQWAERDKQKARNEKDLLQFLKMIEDRQTQLRTTTKALSNAQDTAYLRQAVMETSESLRTLHEEIEPLKQKISQQIQQSAAASAGGPPQTGGNQPGSTQPNAQADQMQQAEQLLYQMADQIGERMLQAATELDSRNMAAAVNVETEGLDQTNQLYMAIAPYQEVLQRAIDEQSKLLPNEQAAVDETDDSESDSAKESPAEADTTEAAVVDTTGADTETLAAAKDFVQLAETQSRITDWSDVLSLKAESELPAAEQQLEALKQSLPPSEEVPAKETAEAKGETDAASDSKIAPNADQSLPEKSETDAIEESSQEQPELTDEQKAAKAQQEQMQKQVAQLTGLVESMKKAIDLAPQAATHSDNASRNLAAKDSDSAMPEQKETDRILKEIAEPLVSDNQDNQQDNQEQQQNEDQDNKDQNQDDQKDGDKEQQKQDEQNKQPEQDKSPDDKQQQQQKEQQEQKDQQQQQTQQEQAESTLRKAREREREHLEKQKQIRTLLQRGIKVDRDW
ncbi:MAG: hypothetical protein WAO83_20715 [Fuerstiella sp.]